MLPLKILKKFSDLHHVKQLFPNIPDIVNEENVSIAPGQGKKGFNFK